MVSQRTCHKCQCKRCVRARRKNALRERLKDEFITKREVYVQWINEMAIRVDPLYRPGFPSAYENAVANRCTEVLP